MTSSIYSIYVVVLILALLGIGTFNLSLGQDVKSPKDQMKNGVAPEEIICKPGYTLVIFRSGLPACITPSTVLKLEERGYIKMVIQEFSKNIPLEETPRSPERESTGSTITGDTGRTSASNIENIPASQGSIVNFYITDDDLNTSPNGVDVIDTQGLLEFTINGVPVAGPKTMIETGPNTGKFYVKLQLPDSIDGKPITQNDIIEIKYFDQSDSAGEKQVIVESIPLRNTFAQLESTGGSRARIGHHFTIRIYEPDANLDSRDVDRIPLSRFEYRGEGGIRTTLANPVFDANASFLYETGENTGIFEVVIKIPRTIDGKTVHIGDWYEITFVDITTPSNTVEDIELRGRIG